MLSADQIKELEDKYKRIARVAGKDGAWEVVFRKPTRAEYKRFRAMANNPAQAADSQEMLARMTVVFPPSAEAFDALLDEYPAIPEASAQAIGALSGFAVEESVK